MADTKQTGQAGAGFNISEIRDATRRLLVAVYGAAQSVRSDQAYPCWACDLATGEEGEGEKGRELLVRALTAVRYVDLQPPREVRRFLGVAGASQETLTRIESLARAKKDLAGVLVDARKLRRHKDAQPFFMDALDLRDESREVRQMLSVYGSGRLHVIQATRRATVLDNEPSSVSFSWHHKNRVLKRITGEQAKELVRSRDAPEGQAWEDIDAIEQSTSPAFYVAEAVKEHLRANIVIGSGEAAERRCIVASMPIFYPGAAGATLPQVTHPELAEPKPPEPGKPAPAPSAKPAVVLPEDRIPDAPERRRRSDRIVADEPLTKTVPIYEMLSTARSA